VELLFNGIIVRGEGEKIKNSTELHECEYPVSSSGTNREKVVCASWLSPYKPRRVEKARVIRGLFQTF